MKSEEAGSGFMGILLIIFVVLKLTDNIDWSWWWVLSPAWIPFAFVAFLFIMWAVCSFFERKT